VIAMKPEFPLTVRRLEDNTTKIYDTEVELSCNLEWCNTDDPEEKIIIKDKQGRPVRLHLDHLEIRLIELIDE
jgi:hypothetical protein